MFEVRYFSILRRVSSAFMGLLVVSMDFSYSSSSGWKVRGTVS